METYQYRGVQSIDLTTGAFLGNPERAFALAGKLNSQVEVYPFLDQKHLEFFKSLARFAGKIVPTFSMVPQGISEDNLKKWTDKYNVSIARFHLPWFNDESDLLKLKNDQRYFKIIGRSYLMEKIVAYFMGTMMNNHGLKLAEKFNTGVNVHPNGLVGLITAGKIEGLKKRVKFVLAENSVDCDILDSASFYRDTLYDLDALIAKIVQPFNLDGILWARDHHKDEENTGIKRNYTKIINSPLVQQHLQAIHLTGIRHRLINPSDPEDKKFLEDLSGIKTKHEVSAALDIDPRILGKYSFDKQVEILGRTIDGVLNIQRS